MFIFGKDMQPLMHLLLFSQTLEFNFCFFFNLLNRVIFFVNLIQLLMITFKQEPLDVAEIDNA